MEKELVQLFETVETGSTAAEERCLDALQKLKGFPVNYDVLVSTQIGKRLRQLAKQPTSEKIQSLASDVVATWRRVILKESAKKQQNRCASAVTTVIEGSNSVKSTKVQTCPKNDGKKPTTVRVPEKRKPEPSAENQDKKNQKPSEVRVPENRTKDQPCAENDSKKPSTVRVTVKRKPEPTAENESRKKIQKVSTVRVPEKKAENDREKIRELLTDAMKKVADETDDASRKTEITSKHDPRAVAEAVETAIFASWGSFGGDQKHKYRSILYNMKDPKNPEFRRKVLTGGFRPEEIAGLSSEQMASEKMRLQKEAIKKKGLNNCENGFKLEATTDAFKCEKCNKRETVYHEVQTRGADEPLTVYITCVSCGHMWNTLGA